VKENTYDELRNKGFKLNSDWSLSKQQADEVFPQLEVRFKNIDKIVFN
jgi:outer membrane receptor for ferric coprogen and ferric-rhodotorulic acid